MKIKHPVQACRVVRKITDRNVFLCLRPADVALTLALPEPAFICSRCAQELAEEIRGSLPGARPFRRTVRPSAARLNGGAR